MISFHSRNCDSSRSGMLLSPSSCSRWLLFVALLYIRGCSARITIVGSSTAYASEQNPVGLRLLTGYSYNARMQYIAENPTMCPKTGEDGAPETFNVIAPSDKSPVALLISDGGGCTMEEKLNNILENVTPRNTVGFVIIGQDSLRRLGEEDEEQLEGLHDLLIDTAHGKTMMFGPYGKEEVSGELSDVPVNDDVGEDEIEVEFLVGSFQRTLTSIWQGSSKQTVSKQIDLSDFALYVEDVSYSTLYDLIDIVHYETDVTTYYGGTRVYVDSRAGISDGLLGSDAAIWMAMAALICACSCSLLIILNANQYGLFEPEEPPPQQPRRPNRRRLTKEQVRRLLPVYIFDGETLVSMEQQASPSKETAMALQAFLKRGSAPQNDDDSPETPLLQPSGGSPPITEATDLSMCSICLDDYEGGEFLRVLPCGHAFHAKCIGKWLSERSATCPLCKTDLYAMYIEDDEEEEGEEGEGDGTEVTTREVVTQTETTPAAQQEQERVAAMASQHMHRRWGWWGRMVHPLGGGSDRRVNSNRETNPMADIASEANDAQPIDTTPSHAGVATAAAADTAIARQRQDQVFPGRSWWGLMFNRSSRRTSNGEDDGLMNPHPGSVVVEATYTIGSNSNNNNSYNVSTTTTQQLSEPLLRQQRTPDEEAQLSSSSPQRRSVGAGLSRDPPGAAAPAVAVAAATAAATSAAAAHRASDIPGTHGNAANEMEVV